VDHLDVVTRASLADPITAGLAIGLGSGLLEDGLDCGPCSDGTTGHERGAVPGALFTSGYARADKEEALGLELLRATDGIGVVGVSAVDDNVALFEPALNEQADEIIYGRASFDEQNDFAGLLELGDELRDGVGALDLGSFGDGSLSAHRPGDVDHCTFGFIGEERIDLGGRSVVCNNIEALVVHVQNKVLTLEDSERAIALDRMKHTMTARPMRPMSPLRKGERARWGTMRDIRSHNFGRGRRWW
jgi:hypothetical protein